MPKPRLKQLAQDGATDGQAVIWNNANGQWEPGDAVTDSYATTVSSWTSSGGRYYADVTHNLGTEDVFVAAYSTSDNLTVLLDDIDRTSVNVVRVWVAVQENIRVLVTVGGGAGVGGGTDTDAIHDNVAAEINAITEKTTPVSADLLLIEDSADSNNKKKVQVGNLPGGDDPDAIHDDVAGEIAAITEKTTPVSADLLLIEDSADSNNKKRVQIGNLPSYPIERKSFFADQFITPTGTDWDVDAHAPLQTDATNSAILVRAFDPSTDEAVGFILDVPADATNVSFTTRARARSAQTADAVLRFSRREIPDNAAIGSWANYALHTVGIPNNTLFQKDSTQNTLATFGLVAGNLYQCQLFRDADAGGDTLTVDLDLTLMTVEFT